MVFKSNPSGTGLASPEDYLSLPSRQSSGMQLVESTEIRTQRDLFMLQTLNAVGNFPSVQTNTFIT